MANQPGRKAGVRRFPVTESHVLDGIAVALHDKIRDLVEGDWSRVEVVSPGRVIIHERRGHGPASDHHPDR